MYSSCEQVLLLLWTIMSCSNRSSPSYFINYKFIWEIKQQFWFEIMNLSRKKNFKRIFKDCIYHWKMRISDYQTVYSHFTSWIKNCNMDMAVSMLQSKCIASHLSYICCSSGFVDKPFEGYCSWSAHACARKKSSFKTCCLVTPVLPGKIPIFHFLTIFALHYA